MKIEQFHIYPIKSCQSVDLDKVSVTKMGFMLDRHFGIINAQNEIITAREVPELLTIKISISATELTINHHHKSLSFSLSETNETIEVTLFKEKSLGKVINSEIDNWLTSIVGFDCKLIKIDKNNPRQTNQSNITFSDVYPIHLISEESVKALNHKLEHHVKPNRFRPNIIISGIQAFEEESWSILQIGDCQFEVVSKTERCSLITINPCDGTKDPKQEPLRTLAKEFKSNGKVNFGIYLVPIKTGIIQKSDIIEITKYQL